MSIENLVICGNAVCGKVMTWHMRDYNLNECDQKENAAFILMRPTCETRIVDHHHDRKDCRQGSCKCFGGHYCTCYCGFVKVELQKTQKMVVISEAYIERKLRRTGLGTLLKTTLCRWADIHGFELYGKIRSAEAYLLAKATGAKPSKYHHEAELDDIMEKSILSRLGADSQTQFHFFEEFGEFWMCREPMLVLHDVTNSFVDQVDDLPASEMKDKFIVMEMDVEQKVHSNMQRTARLPREARGLQGSLGDCQWMMPTDIGLPTHAQKEAQQKTNSFLVNWSVIFTRKEIWWNIRDISRGELADTGQISQDQFNQLLQLQHEEIIHGEFYLTYEAITECIDALKTNCPDVFRTMPAWFLEYGIPAVAEARKRARVQNESR